MNSTTPVKR